MIKFKKENTASSNNEVFQIAFFGDQPTQLEKLLSSVKTFPVGRSIRKFRCISKCDKSNEFNPSSDTLAKHREIIDWAREIGEEVDDSLVTAEEAHKSLFCEVAQ